MTYISLWATAPPLGVRLVFRLVALGCCLLWLVIETLHSKSIFQYPTKRFFLIIGFLFYSIITNIFFDFKTPLTTYIQLYILLLFILFCDAHSRRDINDLKPVIYAILLSYPIWGLRSLYAVSQNPKVMRQIIRSSDYTSSLMESGIGGYAFVYSSIFFLPVLGFGVFKYKHVVSIFGKFFFILLSLNFLVLLSVVIFSAYSTAIIVLSMGFLILLFYHKKNIVLNLTLLGVFIGLVFAIPWILQIYIYDILEFTRGTNYFKKIQDINESLITGRAEGTLYDRVERYGRSIGHFLERPLIGTLSRADLGKHSILLDTFAQYGIFVGLGFCYIFLSLPWSWYKRSTRGNMNMAVFFVFFAIMLLNNIIFAMGPIIFLIVPFFSYQLTMNNEK